MTVEAVAGLEERFHRRIGHLRGADYLAWRAAAENPGRAGQDVVLAHVAGGQQTDDVCVERNDIRVVGGELGIVRCGSPGVHTNDVAWTDGLAGDRVEGRAVRRYSRVIG